MKVRFCKYIFGAALAALTACNEKLPAPVPSVGEADNAIVLKAQVVDGSSGVQTKAEGGRHAKHTPFDADNKIYNAATLIQIAGRVGRKIDAPKGEVFFLVNKETSETRKATETIESKNKHLQNMF